MKGIYIITNKLNDRIFVGRSSINLQHMWAYNIGKLAENNHQSVCLQLDYNLFGQDVLSISIIPVFEEVDLLEEYNRVLKDMAVNEHKDIIYNVFDIADEDYEEEYGATRYSNKIKYTYAPIVEMISDVRLNKLISHRRINKSKAKRPSKWT